MPVLINQDDLNIENIEPKNELQKDVLLEKVIPLLNKNLKIIILSASYFNLAQEIKNFEKINNNDPEYQEDLDANVEFQSKNSILT